MLFQYLERAQVDREEQMGVWKLLSDHIACMETSRGLLCSHWHRRCLPAGASVLFLEALCCCSCSLRWVREREKKVMGICTSLDFLSN